MAAITANRDKLRLELGDTDEDNPLFNDDEIAYFLAAESDDILPARLRAAEAAVFKLARAYDFATDGQTFNRSQMSKAYAAMAKQLRAQGVTTSSDPETMATIVTTVVDGYSQEIANDEIFGGTASPRAQYYGRGHLYNDLP